MHNALILMSDSELKYLIFILIIATYIFSAVILYIFRKTKLKKSKSIIFDSLINTLPGGVFICRKDDVLSIKFCNKNFLNIIGCTRSELHSTHNNRFINLINEQDVGIAYKTLFQQLQISPSFEIKLRINNLSGKIVWTLWKGEITSFGNQYYLNCVIVDITESVYSESKERINEERYKIVAESSDSVIFEYSIKDKTVYYTNKFKQKFGEEPITRHMPESIINRNKIHSGDIKNFLMEYNSILKGKQSGSIEVRLKKANGEYFWANLRYTSILDAVGNPIRVIGKIIDIDRQKRETENLIRANQMDSFTGLYNKTAILELIDKYIRDNSKKNHAVFFIDIDNFKDVNDCYGHIYGDKILFELSNLIKKQFRHTDLVGRIGGDEFLVLVKDYIEEDFIHEKAQLLCDSIRDVKTQVKDRHLTISAGIALYPRDGKILATIYEKADIALYAAKSEGKNKYKIYSQDLAVKQYLNPYQHKKAHQDIFIKEKNIDEYTDILFNISYCVNNIQEKDKTVNKVLSILGDRFKAHRVYIYSFEDGHTATNTHYWHLPEYEAPEKIINLEKSSYMQNYNENNFFCYYESDTETKEFSGLSFSDNTAFLQCKITKGEEIKGFLGYEFNSDNHMLTREEIETLSFAAKLLSCCLYK